MNRISSLLILPLLIFFSCTDADVDGETNPEEYVPNEKEVAYEEYMAAVDANDSLGIGNSLFYSRGESEFTEIEFYVNGKNEMVKMIETYTQPSSTVAKNVFYLKNNQKFASRELFEVSENGQLAFMERVTYYDEKEKPIFTKVRTAPYEQDLELESFQPVKKQDCNMKNAIDKLNQSGDYSTTFQGFVKMDGYTYLIVGGTEDDSFTSSLVVQYEDATIKKLMQNEMKMIGTPLIVDFQTLEDPGEGFEYQILRSVSFR